MVCRNHRCPLRRGQLRRARKTGARSKMGSSYSTEPAADGTLDSVVGQEYGFRVHRVEPNSPGQKAGLQSIIDYIVVANGVRLDHDDGSSCA